MSNIVLADDEHLAIIKEWLIEEERDYELALEKGEDATKGFHCHWDTICEAKLDKKIFVVLDGDSPKAFIMDRSIGPELIEVHPKFREEGIGRLISKWIDARCIERNLVVFEIVCSPITSWNFWKKMGYQKYPSQAPGSTVERAFKTFPYEQRLGDGQRKSIEIEFFSKEEYFSKNRKPYFSADVDAEQIEDAIFQLPRRILDLSRYCSAPLRAYSAAKEINHGNTSFRRIQTRRSAHCID